MRDFLLTYALNDFEIQSFSKMKHKQHTIKKT